MRWNRSEIRIKEEELIDMLQNIFKVFYQHFLKTCNCHLWYEIPPLTACFQAEE